MGVIQNIWAFLWPAPLLTSSFPSTFTVYLLDARLFFLVRSVGVHGRGMNGVGYFLVYFIPHYGS